MAKFLLYILNEYVISEFTELLAAVLVVVVGLTLGIRLALDLTGLLVVAGFVVKRIRTETYLERYFAGLGSDQWQMLRRWWFARYHDLILAGWALFVGLCLRDHFTFEILEVLALGTLLYGIVQSDLHMTDFFEHNVVLQKRYPWNGAAEEGIAASMRKMEFQSEQGQPYVALIGLRYHFWVPLVGTIDAFHTYGCVRSDAHGKAVVKTWMGRSGITFLYLFTIPSDRVMISDDDAVQHQPHDHINRPHALQRWMFHLGG